VTRRPDDAGAIVLGWLTKVALSLAIVGFLSYDGISLVTATVSTNDHAATLASEAADDVKNMRSVDKAYAVIAEEAEEGGDSLAPKDFVVASTGHVRITLTHDANSIWMRHIGPLKKYLHVRASAEGAPAQ
jgi:hypothetical protein